MQMLAVRLSRPGSATVSLKRVFRLFTVFRRMTSGERTGVNAGAKGGSLGLPPSTKYALASRHPEAGRLLSPHRKLFPTGHRECPGAANSVIRATVLSGGLNSVKTKGTGNLACASLCIPLSHSNEIGRKDVSNYVSNEASRNCSFARVFSHLDRGRL